MTPEESTIMDAWDDGQSMQDIARDLRMPLRKVRKIVSCYHEKGEGSSVGQMMVEGSAKLAAAVNAARGA